MADLSSASTYHRSVQGNRLVYDIDVSSAGGSTSDTVFTPLTAITAGYAYYRSTAPIFGGTWTSLGQIGFDQSTNADGTRNAIIRRSSDGSALPVTIHVEGR